VLTVELRDVRERRKVLLTPVAAGGGLGALLRGVAADSGLRCWLLTGTGRVIAGTGELPRACALRLAARYQGAAGSPEIVAEGDDGTYTLVPVGGQDGAERVTGWFLACAGRESEWNSVAARALADLEADAVVEQARLAARLAGERGLAEALIGRLAAGAGDGTHTEALLRAAGLRPGYLAVAVRTEPAAAAQGPGGTAGSGTAGPYGAAWLDTELAEELLGHYAGRVAVAAAGDETFAVVPAGEAPDGSALAAWLREAAPVLRAAGIRLTVGMSALVPDTTGLTAALSEASAARRAVSARPVRPAGASAGPAVSARQEAQARPEGTPAGLEAVVIAISAEVDSHELLLASVPAPVLRSFRGRLLGPLLDYDRRHNAELVPTLQSFLACDGSWSACASRMYVHVNTVRYRIGRIESLTGRNLSALPDRVDFFLALRAT
jgi:hypothetical protein